MPSSSLPRVLDLVPKSGEIIGENVVPGPPPWNIVVASRAGAPALAMGPMTETDRRRRWRAAR